MDNLPPRYVGPTSQRATREMRRLAPESEQKPASNPIGGMLGCLAAGAWCFVFVFVFRLTGPAFLLVGGLGFLLITFGLILAGVSIGEALAAGRRRHG